MSAYGAAPRYKSAELQRSTLTGRLMVATHNRDRFRAEGDYIRADRWSRTVDELLDMLGEVQGIAAEPTSQVPESGGE